MCTGGAAGASMTRDGIAATTGWQAHVREGIGFIEAENLGALTDDEILRESVIRNATHGHQLSMPDKRTRRPVVAAVQGSLPVERGAEPG